MSAHHTSTARRLNGNTDALLFYGLLAAFTLCMYQCVTTARRAYRRRTAHRDGSTADLEQRIRDTQRQTRDIDRQTAEIKMAAFLLKLEEAVTGAERPDCVGAPNPHNALMRPGAGLETATSADDALAERVKTHARPPRHT